MPAGKKPCRNVRQHAERIREKIRGVKPGILPAGFEAQIKIALRRKTNHSREVALCRLEHDIEVYKILAGMPRRPV